ncbi:MAG: VCBS domain-containing protein [Pseudomonadota bacterium]
MTRNTAPDARNNSFEVSENASGVVLNVLSNDTDCNNDKLTIVAVNGSAITVGQWIKLPNGSLLRLNSNGTFSYNTNDAFDSLKSGQEATDRFTYKISDGKGGYDTATVTITIDGTSQSGGCGNNNNHAPVGVADCNAVVESGVKPGNTPFAGTPTATGNVLSNDTDVDQGRILTVAAVNGAAGSVGQSVTGTYGSVVIGANGGYTYTLNNNDTDTNALPQGATVNDVFTYRVTDQFGATSTTTLTIKITGTNDAPVAVADTNAGDPVVEAGAAGPGDPTAVGNVLNNDTDVDTGRVLTVSAVNGVAGNVGATVGGTYGSVVIGANGGYTYTLNNNDPDTNALAQGQTVTEVFTYVVKDEFGATSTTTLTITIQGTDDAPVATVDCGAAVEAGVKPGNTPFAGTPSATGNVLTNDTDVDTGTVLTVAAVAGLAGNVGQAVAGTYGSVVIGANGAYIYTLNNTDSDTNALAQGATVNDVFTYKVTDQFGATSTTTLTIKITGTNDVPVAVADTNAGDPVVEAGADGPGDPTAVGNVLTNDTDIDTGYVLTVAEVNGAGANVGNPVSGTYGSVVIGADGSYTYTLDNTNPATQALAQGETVNEVFHYTVTDEFGATSTTTLTITITGTNDTPTFSGQASGTVIEKINVDQNYAGPATASGQVVISDPEAGQSHFLTPASLQGNYGTFTFDANDGHWSYTIDQNRADPLAGGQHGTDILTVTSLDGSATQDITIDVVGANDAPADLIFNVSNVATTTDAVVSPGFTLGSFQAIDVDSTDFVYSLIPGTGTTASSFSLVPGAGGTATLSFGAAPATNHLYNFSVQVTDVPGGAVRVENFAVHTGTTAGETLSFVVGATADISFGLNGGDTLTGGVGDDTLVGGSGNDILSGGSQNDVLVGGAGVDTVTGGSGNDNFVFTAATQSAPGTADTITDFVANTSTASSQAGWNGDVLDFSAITGSAAQHLSYGGASNSAQSNSVTWFEDIANNRTIVQADVSGDTTADMQVILTGINLNLNDHAFLL